MQIFTLDDEDFPELLSAWYQATHIGKYWKGGSVKYVAVTSQFVMVAPETSPTKLAIKPVRSLDDAHSVARHILDREKLRGCKVEIAKL